MFEGLNSPSIHTPPTLQEFSQTIQRYPNAKIWAGGTALMSRDKSYPSRENNPEIICLGEIEDLKKMSRNDRMIEVGAMVPLNEILKSHRSSIPEILRENIEAVGSPLLTGRATLGGAIATNFPLSTLPGTLIVLGANVEMRTINKHSTRSKWTPLPLLVNTLKNAQILLPPNTLITRARVSLQDYDCSYFREEGSYINDTENTVAVAFTAKMGQDNLLSPHIALTFPKQGLLYSKDLDNILMQLHFPLGRDEFKQFLQITYTFINAVMSITNLQKSRLNYILEDLMNTINTKTLAPNAIESGLI